MKERSGRLVGAALVLGLALASAACGGTAAKPSTSGAKTGTSHTSTASATTGATSSATTSPAAPATKSATSAKPLVKVSVMMAYLATGWDAGFWVAQAKGFYKQQGLDVTSSPGKATFQTVENVATGHITFGQIDGGTLITAIDRGIPLIGVAQLFKGMPFAITVPASSSIKTIGDLKGKSVGDNPANATAQLLPGVLAYNHLKKSQIHFVNMSNNTLPVALLKHEVDAIAALSIGQGAVIEFKGMPLRFLMYNNNGINQPGFGIVTSTAFAKAHPGVVRRFIVATRMGMNWTKQHPAQAEAILHKGDPHTNVKLLEKQLQLSLPWWSKVQAGAYDLNQYKVAQQELKQFGVVKKTVPVSQLVTNQYVPKG